MPGIADVVSRHAGRPVCLDTKLFIYVLNGAPGLAEKCVSLLGACCRNEVHGVTGDLTMAELRVQPLRHNDVAAVRAVREMLLDSGTVTLIRHDRACFERAARLRAAHALKVPDALHLATALGCEAGCSVSNDRGLPAVAGIEISVLGGLSFIRPAAGRLRPGICQREPESASLNRATRG